MRSRESPFRRSGLGLENCKMLGDSSNKNRWQDMYLEMTGLGQENHSQIIPDAVSTIFGTHRRMLEALEYSDEYYETLALRALGEVGEKTSTVLSGLLFPTMVDQDAYVRAEALEQLGKFDPRIQSCAALSLTFEGYASAIMDGFRFLANPRPILAGWRLSRMETSDPYYLSFIEGAIGRDKYLYIQEQNRIHSLSQEDEVVSDISSLMRICLMEGPRAQCTALSELFARDPLLARALTVGLINRAEQRASESQHLIEALNTFNPD